MRPGQNTITRRSNESTLTIPYERTFRDLDTNRPTSADQLAEFNFCGCGWPQHVLIPKGDAGGFRCELFVMISNYEDDRVRHTPFLNKIHKDVRKLSKKYDISGGTSGQHWSMQ